jgi:hypothetical protein
MFGRANDFSKHVIYRPNMIAMTTTRAIKPPIT